MNYKLYSSALSGSGSVWIPNTAIRCIHPLLLLSSTPDSKLILSTNHPFLHSSSTCTFPPIGRTPWLHLVFVFFLVMLVLTLALCARLSWLLVSY